MAKLFLNSLWGTFGQRYNLLNINIVRQPDELYSYLFSPACAFIDEDAATVSWNHAKGYMTLAYNTNIAIGFFTTTYSDLELYNLAGALQDHYLYLDRGSVISVSHPGDGEPPPQ